MRADPDVESRPCRLLNTCFAKDDGSFNKVVNHIDPALIYLLGIEPAISRLLSSYKRHTWI